MTLKFVSSMLIMMCLSVSTLAETVIINSGTEKNQLIELYTSEGCSSCPPADSWISQLRENPRLWTDIIPIAFHVDYWDRLGWKDELASRAFSQRQRRYREQGGISQVYTPGFVVDGQEWRGFFRKKNLRGLAATQAGQLSAAITGHNVAIQYDALTKLNGQLTVHCALLGFDISNEIKAGENRGQTLHHDFAVIGYTTETVNVKNNSINLETKLPDRRVPASRTALVVWVSDVDNQAPIQAAGNWL